MGYDIYFCKFVNGGFDLLGNVNFVYFDDGVGIIILLKSFGVIVMEIYVGNDIVI